MKNDIDDNWNTGSWNTGFWNTGSWNTGSWNTGFWNTGSRNTGSRNTGNWNTGSWNTGFWNTGNWNTGSRNTGFCNTGTWNTGGWNTGSWNTGFFCVETPTATFFDKPTNLTFQEAFAIIPHVELPVGVEYVDVKNMTKEEKIDNKQAVENGWFLRKYTLPLQTSFAIAWKKMSKEEQSKWTSLPNFDADKFLATNGVDVRKTRKIVTVRTITGDSVQIYAN